MKIVCIEFEGQPRVLENLGPCQILIRKTRQKNVRIRNTGNKLAKQR